MTPLELARNLARDKDPKARTLAVAMVLRALTDDDPHDPTRQGWPLSRPAAQAACEYLGLDPNDEDLIAAALAEAPRLSDAILNRGA